MLSGFILNLAFETEYHTTSKMFVSTLVAAYRAVRFVVNRKGLVEHPYLA